jgi:hypothetical protein
VREREREAEGREEQSRVRFARSSGLCTHITHLLVTAQHSIAQAQSKAEQHNIAWHGIACLHAR